MPLDLTQKPRCYTYWLSNISDKIERMFNDNTCTVTQMKRVVADEVKKSNDTPARRTFLQRLAGCYGKWDVQNLCNNSINAGKYYYPC